MTKGPIGGMTDYSHQSFQNIINDLEKEKENTDLFIQNIEDNIQILSDKNYWQNQILFNFRLIIGYSIKHYKTASEEFNSISREIKTNIHQNHCTRLRQIAKVADEINRSICRLTIF